MKSVISLSDQLNMFKEYIKKIKDEVGESRTTLIVSKSIYIVCIGSDDIANTYVQTPIRRIQYNVPSYTELMAAQASSFLQVRALIFHPQHKITYHLYYTAFLKTQDILK